MTLTKFCTALLLGIGLASCQGPVTILVAPEATDLIPALTQTAPAMEKQTGLKFQIALTSDKTSTPTDVLFLSVDTPLPDALVALPRVDIAALEGRSPAPALSRPGNSVALFWDLPGITVFSQELPAGSLDETQSWIDPSHSWPRVKHLLTAGGETDLRLLAWLGQSGSDGTPPTAKMLQGFSAWLVQPRWSTDTWRMTRADTAQNYQGGRGWAFVETFRDFYRANPPGFRRFFPLDREASGHPLLVGSVLSLEARGGEAAQKAGRAWALALTEVTFQREFSQKTGWMPGNLAAPVLETASAEARKLLLRAASFTPTAAVTPAVRDQLQLLFQNPAQIKN